MLLLYSYVQDKIAMPLSALTGLQAWLTGAENSLVSEWVALLCGAALGTARGLALWAGAGKGLLHYPEVVDGQIDF